MNIPILSNKDSKIWKINIKIEDKHCPLSLFFNHYSHSLKLSYQFQFHEPNEKIQITFLNKYKNISFNYKEVTNYILNYNNENKENLLKKEVLNAIIAYFRILHHYEVHADSNQEESIIHLLKNYSFEKIIINDSHSKNPSHCIIFVDLINQLLTFKKGFKEEFNKQIKSFIEENYQDITEFIYTKEKEFNLNQVTYEKSDQSTSNKYTYMFSGSAAGLGIMGFITYILSSDEKNTECKNSEDILKNNSSDDTKTIPFKEKI